MSDQSGERVKKRGKKRLVTADGRVETDHDYHNRLCKEIKVYGSYAHESSKRDGSPWSAAEIVSGAGFYKSLEPWKMFNIDWRCREENAVSGGAIAPTLQEIWLRGAIELPGGSVAGIYY